MQQKSFPSKIADTVLKVDNLTQKQFQGRMLEAGNRKATMLGFSMRLSANSFDSGIVCP